VIFLHFVEEKLLILFLLELLINSVVGKNVIFKLSALSFAQIRLEKRENKQICKLRKYWLNP